MELIKRAGWTFQSSFPYKTINFKTHRHTKEDRVRLFGTNQIVFLNTIIQIEINVLQTNVRLGGVHAHKATKNKTNGCFMMELDGIKMGLMA